MIQAHFLSSYPTSKVSRVCFDIRAAILPANVSLNLGHDEM